MARESPAQKIARISKVARVWGTHARNTVFFGMGYVRHSARRRGPGRKRSK
jgi:hypothetical protein